MHLLILDAYHLGDPLFLSRLGPGLREGPRPLVIVHGGGEALERSFEAEGVLGPEARREALAEPRWQGLVGRSFRDLNRQIVHALNEAGVPAVGVHGSDRGLLRADGGGLTARAGWLWTSAEQGAVPVLSTLSAPASGPVEALNLEAAAAALLDGRPDATLLVIGRRGGGGGGEGANPADGDIARAAPLRALARRVALQGRPAGVITDGRWGEVAPLKPV